MRQGILDVEVPLLRIGIPVGTEKGIEDSRADIGIRSRGDTFRQVEPARCWVTKSGAVGAQLRCSLLAGEGGVERRRGRESLDTRRAVRSRCLERGRGEDNAEAGPDDKVLD